jgi:hypothetical protein
MSTTSARYTLFCSLVLGSTALGCAGDDADSPDQPKPEELAVWLPAVSEESARPASCAHAPIDQVQCRGDYCDDIAIHCSDAMHLNKISSRWLPGVSEEDGVAKCAPGEVVSGISCAGKWCDVVSVECARFAGLTPQVPAGLGVANPFSTSEEDGGLLEFPLGYYPDSIACTGKYCDTITFHVTKMTH